VLQQKYMAPMGESVGEGKKNRGADFTGGANRERRLMGKLLERVKIAQDGTKKKRGPSEPQKEPEKGKRG